MPISDFQKLQDSDPDPKIIPTKLTQADLGQFVTEIHPRPP